MSIQDHIDFIAAHPAPRSFQGLKAPQLGLDDQRTTCFQLVGGVFSEGIRLSTNSSFQVRPALFVGRKRYVMVDSFNPAPIDQEDAIRAASIRWAGADSKVPLLTRRALSDNTVLIYVDTVFGRQPRTVFKEHFSSKIVTGGRLIAWDRNEALVALASGESIEILYADGSVRQILNENGRVKADLLSIEDQAARRLCHLTCQLDTFRKELTGDSLVKATDKIYHEFVAIMRVGGGRSEDVFKMTYSRLEDAGEQGLLGAGVQRHALEVLEEQGRSEYMQRLKFTCARRIAKAAQNHELVSPVLKQIGKGGVPQARRQKLAERAARDRAQRAAARGSSAEKPLKATGKKSKK